MVFKQGVQARGLNYWHATPANKPKHAGISTADYFCGIAQTGEHDKGSDLLHNLPEGTTELMCHPGYRRQSAAEIPNPAAGFARPELEIFTNPEVRNLVASQGIRLIDYGFVAQKA